MTNYFLGIAIALDQLANAVIGGDPDVMISARAFEESEKDSLGWMIAEVLIDTVFFWQTDHCKNAWEYEKEVVLKKAKTYKEDANERRAR